MSRLNAAALTALITVLTAATAGTAGADHIPYKFSPFGWKGTIEVSQQGDFFEQISTISESIQLSSAISVQVKEDGAGVYTGTFRRDRLLRQEGIPCKGGTVTYTYRSAETGIIYTVLDTSNSTPIMVARTSGAPAPGGLTPYSLVFPAVDVVTTVNAFYTGCGPAQNGTDTSTGYRRSIPGVVWTGGTQNPWTVEAALEKPAIPRVRGSVTLTPQNHGTITTTYDLTGCGEELGPAWPGHFKPDPRLSALNQPFQGKVKRFIAALEKGGAKVRVISVYRPKPRNYLMHWAWRVAYGDEDPAIRKLRPKKPIRGKYTHVEPDKVPPYGGPENVPICWMKRTDGEYDRDGSIEQARSMVSKYRIKLSHGASATSNHANRTALDMEIGWAKTLEIPLGWPRCAQKRAPTIHCRKKIDTTPRSGQNPKLWAVARTYGVFKYKDPGDPEHWSASGG